MGEVDRAIIMGGVRGRRPLRRFSGAIGQSAVFGNTRGWEDMGSGVLQSYGDNDFNANSNNSGSLTPVAKQ